MLENLKTVLNVEDNDDNRLLVRRLLQFAGFQVVEARNGFEALQSLQTCRPDLILVDINMPDMDGYSLTSQIKTFPHLLNTPIIAITANALRGDREKTFQAGCDGYIEKPIDIDTFMEQINYFLVKQ